ncbi:MAG: 50S ribosomal protein L11 methyltransferase [Deltaproteobacteria bacterium]|nr:50S ribosomal protein L11 methyltransferase [Deltaproteobacteria bacterium]
MGNWVEDDTSFLFFSAPAENEIEGVLKAVDGLKLFEKHVFPYEVWQGGSVEPVWVDDCVIVPPWVCMTPPESVIKIMIDPGVVFGNCLHPTTRDCLRALSICASRSELNRVIDLGTGTGVLAIAAALLGADKVLGIDLNPLCVRTAQKNVELNELTNIRMVAGDAQQFALEPVELLVANIHHGVIMDILDRNLFPAKMRVILSGLMRTQAREVKARLVNAGFNLVREWDNQMIWYTLLAERRV